MPETHELIAAAADQLLDGEEVGDVLTWLAYAVERETVRSLVGTTELARALGVSERRARQVAERAHERGVGRRFSGWVFTAGEVRKLVGYRNGETVEVANDGSERHGA